MSVCCVYSKPSYDDNDRSRAIQQHHIYNNILKKKLSKRKKKEMKIFYVRLVKEPGIKLIAVWHKKFIKYPQ